MRIKILIILCLDMLIAGDISGLYLTHEDTEGGQSIVEIFKHEGKYYVYGVKNLENSPTLDTCNKNARLRQRRSVGVVFGYDYVEKNGEFVNGKIYDFYNCRTYYGKIVPIDASHIYFIGAYDRFYLARRSYKWKKLTQEEAKQYTPYRLSVSSLMPTIADTRISR